MVLQRSFRIVLSLALGALCSGTALAQNLLRITVDAPRRYLAVGETVQLTVTGAYSDGSTRNLTAAAAGTLYAASPLDEGVVALVSPGGLVTAVAPGFELIYAFNGSVSGSILITTSTSPDTDGDGLPDSFEVEQGLNPASPADGGLDLDGDGLSNRDEFLLRTDLHLRDSDGDGVEDGDEVAIGTEPRSADTDGDGRSDGQELIDGTDPTLVDDAPVAPQPVLDQRCKAMVLNRTTQVNFDGSFALPNVPVPRGAIRIRVVCEQNGKTIRGQSPFALGVANGATLFGEITFGDDNPIPVALAITSPAAVLTPAAPGAQLVTTGKLVDGTDVDVTLADSGTFYLSSNPQIASVSANGFVTARSSGTFLVTATHEGVIATIQLRVALANDADGDGLPDDYERVNGFNPGGVNLARLPGVVVNVSSASPYGPKQLAVDGNNATSWYTGVGDSAALGRSPSIELVFPADQRVAQVRLLGNRPFPNGSAFLAGTFAVFDAAGTEISSSGPVPLPFPTRDLSVAVDLDGVRRVRFTSTSDQSLTPGLSEFQVISRPGGAALDPNNPADAAQDFDLDGLTNLQEFARGTSPYAADTDADGLSDAAEIGLGSNPLSADTDGDRLADGLEQLPTADTDFDGVRNLLDPDSDGDGLPDGIEVRVGLSPLSTDTNFNGIPDGSEDSDFDGLANLEEVRENTDLADRDSDGDGIFDGEEVLSGADGFVTSPLRRDTDRDQMWDGWEVRFGFDPTSPDDANADADGDGLTNLEEFLRGSDPRNGDAVSPAVAQVLPADGATNVPINGIVVVQVTEPLLASSVVRGVVRLFQGTTEIPGSVSLSSDRLFVTFQASQTLTPNLSYHVSVFGLRDLASNPMAGTFTSSFTTGDVLDNVRPFVVGTTPPAGVPDVPVNSPVTIYFSERMNPASLTPTLLRLQDNRTFTAIPLAMIQIEPDGRTASLVPQQPLPIGRPLAIILGPAITDAAGNPLIGETFFPFTTEFRDDAERPRLVAISPPGGALAVPVNARIVVQFDETINSIAAARGVRVSRGGEPVAGGVALSDANRRLTFTPSVALEPGSVYAVEVTSDITDLIGFPLANPQSITFTTGAGDDISAPIVTAIDPSDGADGVPTNATVRVTFSEAIDPTSVNEATLRLLQIPSFAMVEGTIEVQGGLRALFTPAQALAPGATYRVEVSSGVQDLAGQALAFAQSAGFTTAGAPDGEPPRVLAVSPPNGATGVPLNAGVVVLLDEPIAVGSASASSISLRTGSTIVAGTVSQSSDRTLVFFSPAASLAPAAVYEVTLSGLTDRAGNALAPQTWSFTTGGATDTDPPAVLATVPDDGAVDVDRAAAIVWTFSEALDPTSVGPASMPVAVDGLVAAWPGQYLVEGATVQFQPNPALPSGRSVTALVLFESVVDLAGNAAASSAVNFTTAGAADVEPPRVLSVTPTTGASEIGPVQSVVLTFSEPLHPSTLDSFHFALFADGEDLFASVSRSDDHRTVTLRAALPANARVTVVVDRVTDLAGNVLAPNFVSHFRTAASFDGARPQVVSERPENGAVGVDPGNSVVLYVDEALDPATIAPALFVSENGQPVAGTARVTGNGRAIEFLPALPWAPDALVEVFLTADARDLSGNRLLASQASFRVQPVASAIVPSVVRTEPSGSVSNVPLNPVIQVEYNQDLDPATVNATTVTLRTNSTVGPIVPAAVSLEGNRVLRITPAAPLAANTTHAVVVTTALRDREGQAPSFTFSTFFFTGTGIDTVPPAVLALSPQDAAAGIGLNAQVRVRFDEPINPLSVTGATVLLTDGVTAAVPCTISFSNGDRDVRIVPHAPLRADTTYRLHVENVTDTAGNAVLVEEALFTTGPEPDTQAPRVVATNPTPGTFTGTPVNAVIALQADEALDPTTLNANTLRVTDFSVFGILPGTYSLSADARRATFVPSGGFSPSSFIFVQYNNLGIEDTAGNRLTGFDFGFSTLDVADTTPPQVVATAPADFWSEVPRNALPTVRFDEPLAEVELGGVVLRQGGTVVPIKRQLSDGNRLLRLRPIDPLDGPLTFSLEVAGVTDLAANALAAPVSASFTTAGEFDLAAPVVSAIDPPDDAIGVAADAVITATFSKVIVPTTFDPDAIIVRDNSGGGEEDVRPRAVGGGRIAGTVTLAADGRSATFVPGAPLVEGTTYFVNLGGFGLEDVTGRTVPFFQSFFFVGQDVTPPEVTSFSPPDGSVGAPVNAQVAVRTSERILGTSVGPSSIVVSAAGVPVAGSVQLVGNNSDRLVFLPDAPLSTDTLYTVDVAGFTDRFGNPVTPVTFSFTTGSSPDPDLEPPFTVSFDPPDSFCCAPVNQPITITFDETIDPTTVDAENILITAGSLPVRSPGPQPARRRQADELIAEARRWALSPRGEGGCCFPQPVAGTYSVLGNTITFVPAAPLPTGELITIRVFGGGVSDLAGNTTDESVSEFLTGS